MAATARLGEGARRWGRLWGGRAEAWSRVEQMQLPTYEEAIRRGGIGRGTRTLDVGCGSGVFLRAAADRGAAVAGVDASERLLALARARVPEADLRHAELESLPFAAGSFDVVTGFNSFFFADDIVAALREAGRVASAGGTVVAQVWGRPERCDLDALRHALGRFRPAPPPAAAPPPPPLWQEGVLEELAASAGLDPVDAFDLSWAFEFADEEELARGLLSAGNAVEALESAPEHDVRAAVVEALAPFRTSGGGYRLENEWRFLLAVAPA